MDDEDGGPVHTIAVANPRSLFSDKKSTFLGGLKKKQRRKLFDALEELRDEFFEEIDAHPKKARKASRPMELPPPGLLVGKLETVSDAVVALKRIELSWRLDYLDALEDAYL